MLLRNKAIEKTMEIISMYASNDGADCDFEYPQ